MSCYPTNISLNTFEIIISYGLNVNTQISDGDTPLNMLMRQACNKCVHNILNLFIKYGANLNIVAEYRETVLDVITYYQHDLNEQVKNCIMTIIDFGETTCNPNQDEDNGIRDFIKYYKCLNIKPAIKNENII